MTETLMPEALRNPSVKLSERELLRLREIVKCLHCGAVPTEQRDPKTGEVLLREVLDSHGVPSMLPYVFTPHAPGCLGMTKVGRPRNRSPLPNERKMVYTNAGVCEACGVPILAALNRGRRTCSSTCRNRLKVLRDNGKKVAPTTTTCLGCSVPMDVGPKGTRQYCGAPCRNAAARRRKAAKR